MHLCNLAPEHTRKEGSGDGLGGDGGGGWLGDGRFILGVGWVGIGVGGRDGAAY